MELFGISFGRKEKNKNNPAASEFDTTINSELANIIDTYAATSLKDRDNKEKDKDPAPGVDPTFYSDNLDDITCVPINSNKTARLRQYSVMSRFTEVNWAIDEIAMDFFHQDENKKIINLLVGPSKSLDESKIKILQEEFDRLIRLFDFNQNRYSLIKNYVTEGEICWENIIDPRSPEKGIRALKYIPTKYFDFVKDKKSGDIIGIYFDKDQVTNDILTGVLSNSYSGASNIFNAMITVPGYTYGLAMNENKIPLYWPQITYFNSGTYNYENTIVYPLIENASVPYQQLSLLQDACIILRITRAPERLVFNIATGGLPEKKAKTMVSAFINSFKSKKSTNSKGEIRNSYDPAAMLEAYFFWKQDGAEGSSVQAINSSAQYDQMNDIDYFLRRIFKAFKIPYTRFKEEGTAVQRKETITYEEYSFTKYILRQQIALANAIKKTFITHLKLRKIWDSYGLNESSFEVEFVKPSLYELYQAQQLSSLKLTIYKDAVEDDVFSKRLAMQKYLGYTKEMADRNFEERRKELLYDAATKYFVQQLEKSGPKDEIPPIHPAEELKSKETPNEEPTVGIEPPTGEEPIAAEEKKISPTEEIEPTPEEGITPPTGEEESVNASTEVIAPEIVTPTIFNVVPQTEQPGVDLLKKEEYPETIAVKKEKATTTFKDIFSKLTK
jgi:hypothetical protein